MAFAERVLAVKLVSDVSSISKDMKAAGNAVESASSRVKGFGRAAASWGKAVGGALILGGVERLVGAIGDGVTAFREEEESVRQFQRTVKNMGKRVGPATKALDRMAERAVDLGFDDGDVIRGMDTFVNQTKSIEDSQRLMGLAMDIARSRQIPLSAAIKAAQGVYNGSARALRSYGIEGKEGMEAVAEARRRERGKAQAWARNHPMEVLFGKISDGFADVVGSLAKGDFSAALKAGQRLVDNIVKGLVGYVDSKGRTVPGLFQRLFDATPDKSGAPKGIVNRLGAGILSAFQSVDWGAAAGAIVSGLGTAITGVIESGAAPELLAAAGALAGALFVSSKFFSAAKLLFSPGKWAVGTVVGNAVKAVGAVMGIALRVGMFLTSVWVDSFGRFATRIKGSEAVKGFIRGIGTKLGGVFVVAFAAGIAGIAAQNIILDALGNLFRKVGFSEEVVKAARKSADFGNPLSMIQRLLQDFGFARGTGGASRGWHMVGERGPELVRFSGGEQVLSSRATAQAMGGSTYNVSVTAGIGDPVEIGRQVDRVLRSYRRRAGLAYT